MSRLTNPNVPQKYDHIWYDTQTVATAATSASFFASTTSNIQNSNMALAGQFPRGEKNVVKGIRIFTKTRNGATALTARDVEEVGAGVVQMLVNGRFPIVQRHAVQCPGGNGVYIQDGSAALAGVTNGFPSIMNTYWLSEPVEFREETFTFTITWITAITLATSAIVRAELLTDRYTASG